MNKELKNNTSSITTRLDTLSHNNEDFNFDPVNIINTIRDGINDTTNFAKLVFSLKSSIRTTDSPILLSYSQEYKPELAAFKNKTIVVKPIDYLVAGTEGLAWVVHFCFILSLRRRNNCNVRGPLLIRALIFLLTVISILLLRSHINNKSINDVLPNLSLGFSISTVTLLILYTLTLIPVNIRSESTRSPHYEVSYYILFTFSIKIHLIHSLYILYFYR